MDIGLCLYIGQDYFFCMGSAHHSRTELGIYNRVHYWVSLFIRFVVSHLGIDIELYMDSDGFAQDIIPNSRLSHVHICTEYST